MGLSSSSAMHFLSSNFVSCVSVFSPLKWRKQFMPHGTVCEDFSELYKTEHNRHDIIRLWSNSLSLYNEPISPKAIIQLYLQYCDGISFVCQLPICICSISKQAVWLCFLVCHFFQQHCTVFIHHDFPMYFNIW